MNKQFDEFQDFISNKLFCIPDYQRGYAWEEEQCEELIEDIDLIEEDKKHYTGTIIIHAKGGNGLNQVEDDFGNHLKEYNIVDGQQRLTTISIILLVLAESIEDFDPKKASGIRNNFIIFKKDGEEIPKLRLNQDSNHFYKEFIIPEKPSNSEPEIESEKRLKEAKIFYQKYFEEREKELGEEYPAWLNEIYSKITTRLIFTVFEIPDGGEAGVIFEATNSRGKKPTEAEIIKNYLLYISTKLSLEKDSTERLVENINRTWKDIYESFMLNDISLKNREAQFFRSIWLLYADYNEGNWNGNKTIKESYNLRSHKDKHSILRDEILDFLKVVRDCCKIFCDIYNPKSLFAKRLYRIGNLANFVPLLMAIRLKAPYSDDTYDCFLNLLERFSFRVYSLAGKRSNAGRSAFYRKAYELYHEQITLNSCFYEISSWVEYYHPKEVFEKGLEEREYWYDLKGIRYLLYEFENYLSKEQEVNISWDDLAKKNKKDTIEHILPQDWSRDYWQKRWTQEKATEALHNIGNLSLTFWNSVYSNKGFDEKKGSPGKDKCYANSPFFMERNLARYDEWTFEAFQNRKDKIINWIKKRWSIDEMPDPK